MVKLIVGARPIWDQDGWHTLDHKEREQSKTSLKEDAFN